MLVEAGRLLSSTQDLGATLQEIAALTLPALADWCSIELPGPGGRMQLAALAHQDAEKVALAHRLRARRPLNAEGSGPAATVLRTGAPVRIDDTGPLIRAAAVDDDHLELLEALGIAAVLSVPLRTGGDVLGALTLVASQAYRRFDDADQAVAEALAQRVADALRDERLLRDRAEIAHVLSAGLRPGPVAGAAWLRRRGPLPAGRRRRPGRRRLLRGDRRAGGLDRRDGRRRRQGRAGRGAERGRARDAAHGGAAHRRSARGARRLNHALRRQGAMSLCTVVAIALPTELPGTAEVVLAGHPPPLLLRDGVAEPIGQTGPMLGVVEVGEWRPVTVELAPRDVLVLYTDGLLDCVLPGGDRFGDERLRRLAERSGGDVGALAAAVDAELHGLRLRDDVALLAIRCPGPPALLARGTLGDDAERLLELSLPGGPTAPRAARHALAEALGGRLSEEVEGDALIVVSELVTNAIRHGGARSDADDVVVHAALRDEVLRLEVTDPGPGFEPGGHGPRADGGYGLHMLDRLATRWGVSGTAPVTVWVELDR